MGLTTTFQGLELLSLMAMNILIVKLSSIGDVVHTLPTLAAIRRAMPDAQISWVVERESAAILQNNPLLNHLIEVDTRALRRNGRLGEVMIHARTQLRGLRASAFDIAIDFQGLLKSAAIARLSKARLRYGFSRQFLREPASRFLLTDKVNVPKNAHVIRKSLTLAHRALEIPVPETDFEFPVSTDEGHRREAAGIVDKTGENFAILNPAGGWVTKLWPAQEFGRLADRLYEEKGLVPVIATGPNEMDLAKTVVGNTRSGKAVIAQLSLKGFYELAKLARIYVGGDTAPTHLAVAAGTPVVGIFGPTEWWRNGSPNPADVCVERLDIGCRVDCGRRVCNNWICLDIPAQTVFRAVEIRLARVNDDPGR